jgi:hypothetical protein
MTPEIEKHLKAQPHLSKRRIVVNNFIGGLSWGLGSAIGATVVFAALGAILNQYGVFDGLKYLILQFEAIAHALPK